MYLVVRVLFQLLTNFLASLYVTAKLNCWDVMGLFPDCRKRLKKYAH